MDEQNKMTARAIQMFGVTQAEVESEYEHSFSAIDDDRLVFALSIMSDAQEATAQGDIELARQWINKAKYHVRIVRQDGKRTR